MGEELNSNGDPTGKPISETVHEYADNLDIWLEDFVNVWEKMSQNGNYDLVEGPKDIMTSRCCIHSSVKYSGGTVLESQPMENTLACQERCRQVNECNWFLFNTESMDCQLFGTKPETVGYDGNHWLGGPPSCPEDENSCNAYSTI